MTSGLQRLAWLLMAVGDDRQHGGNDGYDDDPDSHYSWDSTVAHHADLAVGDQVALWDKRILIGVSVIEEITTGQADKVLHRCPDCHRAGIKARQGVQPQFKCYKCGHEFDRPDSRIIPVTTYRSRHDAGWCPLEGVLTGGELRSLCHSPKSQQSLRPMRWSDLLGIVAHRAGPAAVQAVNRRDLAADGHSGQRHGYLLATVRVRVGQGKFRAGLLADHGPTCAMTGPAPAEALEAAHLYSYARLGEHHHHGGMLLRRDIHRLFDDGALAVNPQDMRVDVAAHLHDYPQYAALHRQPLTTPVTLQQGTWLRLHWAQHRAAGRPAPISPTPELSPTPERRPQQQHTSTRQR